MNPHEYRTIATKPFDIGIDVDMTAHKLIRPWCHGCRHCHVHNVTNCENDRLYCIELFRYSLGSV